ncbi:MAG: hypothetical protein M1837_006790 [Sclerophora amabilis]|nr:MAG: hypothetical protein M1837_006790 [Sclerophora amabilis]
MDREEDPKQDRLDPDDSPKEEAPAKAGRGWRFWIIFACLAITALMSSLEGSIVATALPTIAENLHASEQYIWVVNVYFLASPAPLIKSLERPSAALQPLYGQLADLWGRRWLMIGTVAVFTLGSGICGGASSSNMLIGGRTIQGLGAGGINMLIELILCDLLPLRERGRFMGLLFVFIVIGSATGPFVGGALVQHVNWRWVFYINLPFGGASIAMLYLVLHVQHRSDDTLLERMKKIDWIGNFVLTAATTSILYALTYGGTRYAWSHSSIIITMVLGLFGQILFGVYEFSPFCQEPVMPPALFKNRTSAAAFILTFLQTLVSFWGNYFLPLYFQSTLLSSPARSGVQILPFAVIYSVAAAVAGGIVTKLARFRFMHFFGFALMTVGIGSFVALDRNTSTAVWVILQIIFGLGLGVVMACLLTAIQAALPDSLNAASTGFFAFVRSIGTIWGVSIPAAIFNNRVDQLLPTLRDPKVQDLLAHGQAYERASKAFINSFTEPTRGEIIGLYEQSLKRVWQLGIIFAGLGFLFVFMEEDLKLRSSHETEFGLKKRKKKNDPQTNNAEAA